jgi:hypothetical protein
MMERILTAREAKRRHQRESADAGEGAEEKDILDILFDMHEDKAAEMPLSRDNMKAFMLVTTKHAHQFLDLFIND